MKSFICPECNFTEFKSYLCVSTIPESKDPWSSVLQKYECAKCKNYIPAHLGERWDDVSLDEAQKEWLEIYKK